MRHTVAADDYTRYLTFDDDMKGTANIRIHTKEGISIPRVERADNCTEITLDASVLKNFCRVIANSKYGSFMDGRYDYTISCIRKCTRVVISHLWSNEIDFLQDMTLKGYSVRYFGYVEMFRFELASKQIYNTNMNKPNPEWTEGLKVHHEKMSPDSITKDMLVVINNGLYMVTQ